jgi:uncharacterized LabA/DUF88 family protein
MSSNTTTNNNIISQDVNRREVIDLLRLNISKLSAFLVSFEEMSSSSLNNIKDRLDVLERKLEHIEAAATTTTTTTNTNNNTSNS